MRSFLLLMIDLNPTTQLCLMAKTFVLAPDSFKESLSAEQACQAMQHGIEKVFSDAIFFMCRWQMVVKAPWMP